MKGSRQHTPRIRTRPPERTARPGTPWLAAAALLLAACTTSGGPSDGDLRRRQWLEAALETSMDPNLPDGTLQVRLAFDGRADLDLYVTDTLQETVYFARREGRSGGTLGVDQRCDALPPRIEEATWAHASAGRYRVGIDYIEACSGSPTPVQWVVEIRFGGERRRRHGQSEPLRFEPVVWEFELAELVDDDAQ